MITITITQADLTTILPGVTDWICWIRITDGVDTYAIPATAPGDLAEADLQAYFDGRAAVIWETAQAKQYPADSGDGGAAEATGGAKAWFADNPNAAQLFTLSIDDLDAAIQNRTAGQETLLLKAMAITIRILARRAGLV